VDRDRRDQHMSRSWPRGRGRLGDMTIFLLLAFMRRLVTVTNRGIVTLPTGLRRATYKPRKFQHIRAPENRGPPHSELFAMRGVPRHIRSDNGPEFIAQTLRRWHKQVGVGTLYIEPGSPWENGYAESFHGRLRDEFLAMEIFDGVRDARSLTASWRDEYNTQRHHSSLGYRTPAGFAAACAPSASAKASAPAAHAGAEVQPCSSTLISPGTANPTRSPGAAHDGGPSVPCRPGIALGRMTPTGPGPRSSRAAGWRRSWTCRSFRPPRMSYPWL
jgi:putative transposase